MCSFVDDILQPLPLEGFEAYSNECLKHYPSAIKAHRLLYLHEKWARLLQSTENDDLRKKISERCVYKFYVHRSRDVSKCTFVAITESNNGDVSELRISIFPQPLTNLELRFNRSACFFMLTGLFGVSIYVGRKC